MGFWVYANISIVRTDDHGDVEEFLYRLLDYVLRQLEVDHEVFSSTRTRP